ncbi:hypothetical protein JCM11491_003297 [Sporobolomyces phaffii]
MAPHAHHHRQGGGPAPLLDDKSTTTTAKGHHYADTLDLARRLSLFTAPFPAEAKSGNLNRRSNLPSAPATAPPGGMDWPELLRKFRKHNPDRTVTASAAQTDQVLHSLLAQTPAAARDGDGRRRLPPLPPVLPDSLRPAALTALVALHPALELESTTATTTRTTELVSARVVYSFGKYLVGDFSAALTTLAAVPDLDSSSVGEPYDWTLRVLGHAVRGFCFERSEYPLVQARESYRAAAKLYELAVERIAPRRRPRSGGPPARDDDDDDDDVSLHRIGETALARLCAIDLVASSPADTYTSHLAYIRLAARCSGSASDAATTTTTTSRTPYVASETLAVHRRFDALVSAAAADDDASATFVDDADVRDAYRLRERLVRSTTSLPRAGEVNRAYLEFVDDLVAHWRRTGCRTSDAGDVVDTLYRALSHTFQSHRVLRYLVRALTVAARYDEAAKAVRLYRELWDKARETDAKRVAREMKHLRRRTRSGSEGDGDDDEFDDLDTDRQFIETAAFGVRLACRYLDDPTLAVDLAQRMHTVLGGGGDDALRGTVELSLGIAFASLAHKEANPETRPGHHAAALAHLEQAAALLDGGGAAASFDAQYHLAYHLFELRQVARALDRAKAAVALDRRNPRAWHLVGLVLTAMNDVHGALQVFETAIDLAEDDDDDEGKEGEEGAGGAQDALAKLEGTAARTKTKTKTDRNRWNCSLTETEQLAIEVQLRLSKNAVVEYLEGPASALEDQQELLAWFSSRSAAIAAAEAHAAAAAPRSAPATVVPTATTGLSKRKSLLGRRVSLRSKRDSTVPPPVPTVVSPPPGLSPPSGSPSPYASRAPSLRAVASRNPSLVDVTTGPDVATTTTTATLDRVGTKLWVSVWLASAASFRRAGKLGEARGAVSEAERVDGDDPDVWSQLAAVYVARGEPDLARRALQRALSYSVDHVASLVQFARLYLSSSSSSVHTHTEVPFAELVLESVTKGRGWDCPEAWFELSRCYGVTGRRDDERECLVWALQLEETRSLRLLDRALDRVL